ncbi:MAG: hypothetical protein ABWK00_03880 [Desulfurococcaceae archaeon]
MLGEAMERARVGRIAFARVARVGRIRFKGVGGLAREAEAIDKG